MRHAAVVSVLAALALAAPSAAGAATFSVNSTGDNVDAAPGNGACATGAGNCTLRAAIQEANALAGADIISVPAGTVTLTIAGQNENAAATGDLDITSQVTIQGAGSGATTVNAAGLDRVFDVQVGGNAAIDGMTIRGGNPGLNTSGSGLQNAGTLTLSNVLVTANTTTGASGHGAGIANSATLTVTNSTISGNTAGGDGGGIQNTKHADLTHVTVSGNIATGNGGGVRTSGFAPDGLHATDLTLTGNTGANGGGLYATATAVLTSSAVTNNTATTAATLTGGGVYSSSIAPEALTVTDSQISGNKLPANGTGGGLANSGPATLTRVAIASNNDQGSGGASGGGVYNTGTLNADSVTVTSNTLGGNSSGGGVYNQGTLNWSDVSIAGNSVGATSDGGGAWNSGTLTFQRVSATGNTAGRDGGGIYNSAFTIQLTDVTLSGNQATVSGGGMRTDADAILLNTTIAGNTAPTAGGLLATAAFPSKATSSIIAGNTGGDCGGGAGAVASSGNNLAGSSCGLAGTGDITTSDPGLRAAAANGGTALTMALLPTSAAIDAGADAGCPALDGRRVTRPQLAHCDIGAYEYSPPVASIAAPACSQDGAMTATVTPTAGGATPTAIFSSVDGGPVQRTAVAGTSAAFVFPEGAHSVEYWGESTGGDVELAHHVASVVVDATAPVVAITSDQGKTSYAIGETASVTVAASDGISGLATDPSASHTPLDTSSARPVTFSATATDRCGNSTTSAFTALVGLRRPVAGRTVNLERVSGVVLVRVPGSSRFVPLVAPTQVRDGSIIDARKGRVRITIDNGRGGLDTADFYGGIFKFTQPKAKKGKTWFANLYLYGGNFNGCPSAPKNPKVATLSAKKQTQGKSVRHLWGSGKGAFRTVGRFASATIRGTTWLTDDKCQGTLTKVTAGKVGVRDFVLKKTTVVKRGKTYFAHPKPRKTR